MSDNADPVNYTEYLKSISFGTGARDTTETRDGVEYRTSIDDKGQVGVVHEHHMGSEIVDAHAFIHEPVAVTSKVEETS